MLKNFLEKLDQQQRERIEGCLKKLKENPFPSDMKYLGRHEGEKVFRYRIGDHRVLYKVKGEIILVAKIDKRPRIYHGSDEVL